MSTVNTGKGAITQTNLGGGGRLGNQLFGISAIYGTALKLGLKPKMPIWNYAKYFDKQFDFLDDEITHIYDEPHFHYSPVDLGDAVEVRSGEPKVLDIRGYFQSPLYWEGYENEIKNLFKLTPRYSMDLGFSRFGQINMHGDEPICAIHIRRGDYVNNNFYADIIADGYYQRAIEYISKKQNIKKYLVFSDDIQWCRDNFKMDQFIYMEGNTDIEDLILMSFCDSFIIANSSFSWWGAYLGGRSFNEKIVIAPQKWFGDSVNFDTKDLIPEEWVRL